MSDPTSPDDPTGVPADSQPPAAPQPETAAAAPAAPAAPAEAAAPSAPPAPAAPTAYPAPDAYGAPAAGYPGGAPQAPYGAPQAPYGAAPTAYATPGEPYPGGPAAPPTAPGARPKVLAIVALALAAVGLIMSFIPVVTWFSGIFLLAGFIVGLVALISKKQGGKGLSIAALAISVVGWIVSIVVTIASIAAFSQAAQDALDESRSSSVSGSEATDEEPAAEEPAGDAQAVEVVETGFGRESFGDSWWYVVILDNPNADYVYDFAEIGVEALSADGTILDSSPQYVTLLSGQTALSGSFLSVGQGEVASIEVRVPEAGEAIASPADETGSFTIEGVTGTSDDYSTTVTGTVSGMFQEDQEFVAVTVVARSADGAIINGTVAYVDRLPADGGKVQFEAMFFDPLPADTTYEASAHL